jgi:autotransporter-associated beta strand protein
MRERRHSIPAKRERVSFARAFTRGSAAAIARAVLPIVLTSASAHAATLYYKGSGAMNALASWNTARDGTGTDAAAFSGNSFVIQSGQNPTANASWSTSTGPGTILIETGGAMSSGAFNPVVTLSQQSGSTYLVSNSTYTSLGTGTINANSTFDYRATTSGVFRSALNYGNVLWNYTVGSDTPGSLTTGGSLSNNTGGGRELRVATGSTPRTWAIAGDISNSAASVLNFNNGNGDGTAVNLSGSFTNNGTLIKSGSGTTSLNFNGSASANATWGTVTTSANFSSLSITVASTKTLTFVDSLNQAAASFTVNGTLNIGSQVLSGTSGNFTLNGGATIITSNATGLDGAITVTGTKTFNTAANYEFRGAATGVSLPSTVNNLTINRASGNVSLDGAGSTQTVNGTLNVYSGALAAGATRNAVSLSSTGNALVMRNSTINSGMAVNLTGATGGNVVFDAANNGTATIAANINLGSQTRTFNIANSAAATDMSVSGGISSGAITKSGTGTLELSGSASNYAGGTTISAGTLLANNTSGSATGTSAVIVQSTGRLGGSGTISGAVEVNGTLSPGALGTNPGTGSFEPLTTGNQNWKDGGKYEAELNATDPVTTHDQVALANLTQPVSSTFTIQVIEIGGGALALNTWIPIATSATGIINGGFDASKFILTDLTNPSQTFDIRASGAGSDGDNFGVGFAVEIEATPAPEPTSVLLFGAGLSSLLLARRRRAVEALV